MMSFSCSVTCTVLGEVVLSNGLVPLRVCFRRLFMHCLVMAVNGQCLGILQAASCFGCATDSMFDMQARWTKVCRAAVSHEQTTLLQGIRRLCRYLLASITALWELYFCLSIRILSPFTHISPCFLEMYTWVYCYGFIVLFFLPSHLTRTAPYLLASPVRMCPVVVSVEGRRDSPKSLVEY